MSSGPHLRCRRARALLSRAADGQLELGERFALDAHLEDCAPCRALHDGLALAGEGLARLAARTDEAAERVDVDAALARLGAALDAEPAQVRRPAPDASRPRLRRTVAAAALVAGLGGAAWWALARDGAGVDRPSTDGRELVDAGAPRVDEVGPPAARQGDPQAGEDQDERLVAEHDDADRDREVTPPTDAELERDARVAASARTRAALLAVYQHVEPPRTSGDDASLAAHVEELSAAASRVEAELADLLAAGWPLARLADGLLDDDEPAVARAAALFVGARGDRGAAVRLAGMVADADADAGLLDALALAALRGRAGGVEGLARAATEERHARAAAARLALVGASMRVDALAGEAVAALADLVRSPAVRDAYGSAATDEDDERTPAVRLLAVLASTGPRAVPALYELAAEAERGALRAATDVEVLDALAAVSDHGPALAAVLARDGGSSLAFAAARASRDDALLPWLEARARATRTSDAALDVLAVHPGERVVGTLARLAGERRVSSAALDALATRLVAGDAGRVAAWIEAADARAAYDDALARELDALAELLLAADAPGAGPALVALTTAASPDPQARTFAALALAEVGELDDADELAARLGADRDDADDERVRAAQLLALARLAGDGAVARVLAADGLGDGAAVLAAIDRTLERDALAVGVHRVARALEDRRGSALARLQRRTSQ